MFGFRRTPLSALLFALLSFLLLPIWASVAEDKAGPASKKLDQEAQANLYEQGVRQYQLGSYYEAVNLFGSLVKNPAFSYYTPSLFMMAKVYLQIGKKTGIKKYLWAAESFLNLYVGKASDPGWDYYYTKGLTQEALSFDERALALYKTALFLAKTEEEQTKTIIAMLRTSVGRQVPDVVAQYAILLNLDRLKKSEKNELNFVNGMNLFVQGRYEKALEYFLATYRDYEAYLISNPNYYYLVAETAYRMGNLKFAEQLFRRILTLVKNEEVIRKVMLRMGDIALGLGDKNNARGYYYLLASKYSQSSEAHVAKLKLIHLMKDQEGDFLDVDFRKEELKDPDSFVVKTLVKNRTNYIGRFALANFGEMVFDIASKSLDERLEWEISLVSATRLEFEQKEYLRMLWGKKLGNLDPARVCRFYSANIPFFRETFGRDILVKIADDLAVCGQEPKRIDLLRFVADRWNDDENRLLLASVFYGQKDFEASVRVLDDIKNIQGGPRSKADSFAVKRGENQTTPQQSKEKECLISKLYAKNYLMLGKKIGVWVERIKQSCEPNDLEAQVIIAYDTLMQGGVEPSLAFAKKHQEALFGSYLNAYKTQKPEALRSFETEVVPLFLEMLLRRLIEAQKYSQACELFGTLAQNIHGRCPLDGLLLLSYTRIGIMESAKVYYDRTKGCEDAWAVAARNIYEARMLSWEFKKEPDVGINR